MTQTTEAVGVGSILASSWGYDQTNVCFYEVIAATAATVTVRQVASYAVSTWAPGMREEVLPIKGKYVSAPMRRKVHRQIPGHVAAVRISSCENAYPWNGQSMTATHTC